MRPKHCTVVGACDSSIARSIPFSTRAPALSRDKARMLTKAAAAKREDAITPEDEHLERFLLELGGDFAFIGRQRRLRIGDEWYRIDLLFFHRKLRCLVVIDLKRGRFTHADAGQMHMYLNYAREHWTR